MRRLTIAMVVTLATLMASTAASQAQSAPQVYPFGSRPFCFSGNKANGGMPECHYYTWEQCRATLAGGADHCYENPAIAWYAARGGRQGKQQRQVRKRSSQ